MIGTIATVIRGEGIASAFRRGAERIADELHVRRLDDPGATIRNVCGTPIAARYGGIQAQLLTRLMEELRLRPVSLVSGKITHLEGYSNDLLHPDIVSVHDFSFLERNDAILRGARVVVFPSQFLLSQYRGHLPLPEAEVIEPGCIGADARDGERTTFAYAGSVKRHKGGHLLPDIIRMTGGTWHIFGGGDLDLLLPLRRMPNVRVHGYYTNGSLSALLSRHRVRTVVLPSIVPESFSLALSECWLGGASVVAFDHGAIAERVRNHGGGWLAPFEEGAEGLAALLRERRETAIPLHVPAAADAAREYVAMYRRRGFMT